LGVSTLDSRGGSRVGVEVRVEFEEDGISGVEATELEAGKDCEAIREGILVLERVLEVRVEAEGVGMSGLEKGLGVPRKSNEKER
jgi:hypothetical protein